MDFQKIEQKWQRKWERAKIFEAEPKKGKKKFYLIFAYPGVSGYLHVGHMKGYSYTDVLARYKRMQGYNVLFPVGSHASGNIAITFAKKIQRKDQEWIDYLIKNGCPKSKISELSDPIKVVEFFNKVYIKDYFKRFGFSADYRRFTCTIWPDYNRFIQWQFMKLRQKRLLKQAQYFATFCPSCGPVAVDPSQTDIQRGGTAQKQEFTLLKFKLEKDTYLIAATLRPETVYGQTNMWVNPNIDYSKVKIDNEFWIISKECANKLAYQKEGIKTVGFVSGQELIGKKCLAPGINRWIPILPAYFCDPVVGTGFVTSVPSDAPYDYMGLIDLQRNKEQCVRYGLDWASIKKIKPIKIIQSKEWGDLPAIKICQQFKIKDQFDPKLKEATQTIYKAGFFAGKMLPNCGKYAGMAVEKAKEAVKSEMIKKKQADIMYELSEEVICRCGARVIIKLIPDQWFIRYSDKKLTVESKKYSKMMHIYPKEYFDNLPEILDWFQDRACARLGNWLGTRLPFDEKWVVEPISDSTLYPSYYLISKYVNSRRIKPIQLTEEFFDFIYLGKGDIKSVSRRTKIPEKLLKQIRSDFEYWYPLDFNIGGKEHQTVHFPVFLMNHVAILQKKFWPCGIFVYWWIIGRGGKIAKSKGGAEPLTQTIERCSADGLRLYYAHAVSPFSDTFWDPHAVLMYKKQVERFWNVVSDLSRLKSKKITNLDKWVLSRLNSRLELSTKAMEALDLRRAVDLLLFEFLRDIAWYQRRGGNNKSISSEILDVLSRALSPFIPHICEEIWQRLGKKSFVSTASWPQVDKSKIDTKVEKAETAIAQILEDVRSIIKILEKKKKKIKKIYLYAVPPDFKDYKDAEDFFSGQFGLGVKVWASNDPKKHDPQSKAAKAKPGIYLE